MKANSLKEKLFHPKCRAFFAICEEVGFIEVERRGGGAGGGDLGVCLWLSFTALLPAVALLAFGVAQVARAGACAELSVQVAAPTCG